MNPMHTHARTQFHMEKFENSYFSDAIHPLCGRYHSILPSTYSTVNRFERSLFRREFRVAANKLRFSLFNVF